MNDIRRLRSRTGLTQAALALAAGTSQPTIAAYEAGRKSPTLDTVQRLAQSVGLEATVEYHSPFTREERRSLFLHRAISRHLEENPESVLRRARATLELMTDRHPSAGQLLREWHVLLSRSVPELSSVLVALSPWARELRHVTPFAGVLSAGERAEIYLAFSEAESKAS